MDLHIRPATPEDDERTVQIYNAIHPDRPSRTVEEQRYHREAAVPEAGMESIVAEVGSQIVGWAVWSKRVYSAEPDVYWAHLDVDPAYWGKGAGSALYDAALERMNARGARKIMSVVREDHARGLAFAEKRGFVQTGYGDRLSRLEVAKANLERSREAEQRLQGSTIRIATLAELDADEDLLRAICAVDNESTHDIPSSGEWTEMPFEQWKKYELEGPGASPELIWVALEGDRPAGLAVLRMRGEGVADSDYTGVARAYRGRGIARALKLKTVEWAAEHGVRYIYTGNDRNNRPILHINMELGYVPLPANIEVVREQ